VVAHFSVGERVLPIRSSWQLARQRLAELLRLHERAREAFEGQNAVRLWFHSQSRYLSSITPAEAIRAGRLDRVEAALEALDSGAFL
jgi:hypothetical protein